MSSMMAVSAKEGQIHCTWATARQLTTNTSRGGISYRMEPNTDCMKLFTLTPVSVKTALLPRVLVIETTACLEAK